jgi:hypothetical protein
MPKRTNDYQKLILAINKHFVSKSATVTESAMLYDASTEQYREIDILIEDNIGGIKVRVVVECTAVKRPLTVAKLDEIIAKHKDCGVNKTVIVSKSGFANTTTIKAQKIGVELITYEASIQKDWPAEFDMLSAVKPFHISYELISPVQLTLVEGESLEGFNGEEDPYVIEHDEVLSALLFRLLHFEQTESNLPPYLSLDKAEKNGVRFSKKWDFEPPITLKSKSVAEAIVIGIQPSFLFRKKALYGELKAGK